MKKLLLIAFSIMMISQINFARTPAAASADTITYFDGASGPWFEWYDFWGGSLPVVGSDTCKYAHEGSGYTTGKNSIKWVMDDGASGFGWAWWSDWNIFNYRDIFEHGYMDLWMKVPAVVDTVILEFKSSAQENRMQYFLTHTTALFNNTWQNYKIPFKNWFTPPPKYNLVIDSSYVISFGIFTNIGEKGAIVYIGDVVAYPTMANVPVELTSFSAHKEKGFVSLSWSTATETNNSGFEVERKADAGSWNKIGFKNGKGSSSEKTDYTYVDNISNLNAQSIAYRLKQIDFNGSYSYSKEVNISNSAPLKFVMQQNYPNPFNPNTLLKYQVAGDNFISLKIYNSLGEEVAILVNEQKSAGSYEVNFNAAGLTSGIYYSVLRNGESSETLINKMLLMK